MLVFLKVLSVLLALIIFPYATYFVLYLFLRGKLKRTLNRKRQYEPSVSLVIATYNEEENIASKLKNIFEEVEYPHNKMEIIVVDSSTDNTPIIVKEWMKKYPNIRLIKEEKRRGLASALNTGYFEAKNEIVIKTDCDQLLKRDSIKNIVSNFADSHVGAVSGKQLLISSSKSEQGYRSLVDWKRLVENEVDSIYLHEPFSA